MTQDEVISIFDQYNALLKGHFKLSSGLHSETYLQCALVLQYPDIAEKLSKALAKKFSKSGRVKIDVVIGPAFGGITLAYEVARATDARALFTERHDGRMVLRRGFSIKKGEKVLVVEDVVTTGGSTQEVVDVVGLSGGEVIGVGAIIDRSAEGLDFGPPSQSILRQKLRIDTEPVEVSTRDKVGASAGRPPKHPVFHASNAKADGPPFESLAKIHAETFEEKDCPLCKKGIPIVKPGSRAAK